MGFSVALRAFWGALTNQDISKRIEEALYSVPLLEEPVEKNFNEASVEIDNVGTTTASRSDALELLAALQRDARFVDFIMEKVDECDDATLGAAARTVHDHCAVTVERCFAPRPLFELREGEEITLTQEQIRNVTRVQLARNSSLEAGCVKGIVAHLGWKASKCNLPKWTGDSQDELVIAPLEVDN